MKEFYRTEGSILQPSLNRTVFQPYHRGLPETERERERERERGVYTLQLRVYWLVKPERRPQKISEYDPETPSFFLFGQSHKVRYSHDTLVYKSIFEWSLPPIVG